MYWVAMVGMGHGEKHFNAPLCTLQQVCGFLRTLQFPPPIKLTSTI